MPVIFFNPYEIKIPIFCENPTTNESYTCTAMPRTKGQLLEGFVVGNTTLASYPMLKIKNVQPETSVELKTTANEKVK